MQIVCPPGTRGTGSDAANVQRIVSFDFGKEESGVRESRFCFDHRTERPAQGGLTMRTAVETADIFRPEVQEASDERTPLGGMGNGQRYRSAALARKNVRRESAGL